MFVKFCQTKVNRNENTINSFSFCPDRTIWEIKRNISQNLVAATTKRQKVLIQNIEIYNVNYCYSCKNQ